MNYLKNILFVIVLLQVFQNCTNSTNQSQVPEVTKSGNVTSVENIKWMDLINLKSDSIQSLYVENAFKVLANGKILEGNQQIKNHLLQNAIAVQSIQSDTIIVAHKKRGLEYEIGEFMDNRNQKYKYLIIWETKDLNRQRVFEFVEEIELTDAIPPEIESRRNLWMQLCNNHNAAELINEMYSKNTLYFNHKPMVKGRDSLIPEYEYMNNKDYELSLSPEVVKAVNNDFVFEIGQCKGSYLGKYILIWRKTEMGKWEIFIDSNI